VQNRDHNGFIKKVTNPVKINPEPRGISDSGERVNRRPPAVPTNATDT
jgi:hypothetical protein